MSEPIEQQKEKSSFDRFVEFCGFANRRQFWRATITDMVAIGVIVWFGMFLLDKTVVCATPVYDIVSNSNVTNISELFQNITLIDVN